MSVMDLTGSKFGRWTVICRVPNKSVGRVRWSCLCDCGVRKEVNGCFLLSGKSRSCGCYNREVATILGKKSWSPIDYGTHYGIPLKNGNIALIDLADYDLIKDSSWVNDGYGYAVCTICRKRHLLHRVIMGVSNPEVEVDHVDHNPLNNRRSNLRLCTHSLNLKNRLLSSNNTTGFQGVYLDKRRKIWYARIIVDGKYIHLGHFSDKESAISARKKAELKHFGEYSILNNS